MTPNLLAARQQMLFTYVWFQFAVLWLRILRLLHTSLLAKDEFSESQNLLAILVSFTFLLQASNVH